MIADRVRCSQREKVLMTNFTAIEAGMVFVVVLSVGFRSNHCNLSSLLPFVAVYYLN